MSPQHVSSPVGFHSSRCPTRTLVRRLAAFLAGLASLAALLPVVHATSDVWDGSTDGVWATSANWFTDPAAVPGTGETATFSGAGSGNTTIDLGTGVTLGTLLFDTSSAAAYTIGSGAVGSQTLTLGTLAGGIQMNAAVANNQLINANLALSTTGIYTIGLTNNSTTNTLTVAGGISASTTGAKTLTVTGAGNSTVSGNITNGTGTIALTKTGSGTVTLSGANTFSGGINANEGTLIFSGASTISTGTFKVGNTASTSGKLSLTGTVDITSSVGFTNIAGSANNATGVINIGSGNALRITGTNGGHLAGATSASGVIYNVGTFTQTGTKANDSGIYLGNAAGSYGYLHNTGTTTVSGRMYVGRVDTATAAGSVGLLDIAGGTVTVSGTNQTVSNGSQGSFLLNTNSGNSGSARSSMGYAGVNVHGGTLSLGQAQTFQTNVGANLYTSINVTGSSSKIATTGAAGFNLNYTSNANNTTTLSLHDGGTLETSLISNTGTSSTGIVTFDGGVLKATAADATALIRSGVTTYVQSGGATINTNGFNTTIASALQAPTGNGISSISLGGTLTGYVGAPVVKISGGGGTGAAVIANFDPTTGTVTGVTITSAGSGYTSAPTITLVGGNGGSTGAGVGTATATAAIGSVTGGGLTKTGTGTLTLSAANTYTGLTTISAGTLALASTGSINNSSSITVASGATFDVSAVSSYTMGAQTLRGAGTVNGAVIVGGAGTLAAGVDASTLGTLTFNSTLDTTSATVLLKLNSATGSADLFAANGLTLGNATFSVSDLGSSTWTGASTFTIFDNTSTGSVAGTFAGLTEGSSITVGSNIFTISYLGGTGNDITLSVASAIPEPSTYAAIFGAAVLGFVVFRRRKSAA